MHLVQGGAQKIGSHIEVLQDIENAILKGPLGM